MNKPEYNRKMKGLDQDMERLAAEIETRNEKRLLVWFEQKSMILAGWTE